MEKETLNEEIRIIEESIKENVDIILGTFNGDKQKTYDFWMDVYPNKNAEELDLLSEILKEHLGL